MKKPKLKHRPRKLRARPLLVAAAITLSTISGCDEQAIGVVPTSDFAVGPRDLAAPHDAFGLAPHD
jgi:hypothetical protein